MDDAKIAETERIEADCEARVEAAERKLAAVKRGSRLTMARWADRAAELAEAELASHELWAEAEAAGAIDGPDPLDYEAAIVALSTARKLAFFLRYIGAEPPAEWKATLDKWLDDRGAGGSDHAG